MAEIISARAILQSELEKTGVFEWKRQCVADALIELEATGIGPINLCITMTDSICHFPESDAGTTINDT